MICEGVSSGIPADRRLDRVEAARLNRKEELALIRTQEKLLEIEAQREADLASAKRDSYSLYAGMMRW